MSHEELKELLSVEAAGGLRGEERGPLAAHLSSCAECRGELDELRDAAAMLVYATDHVAPPAHLRARILESVRVQRAAPTTFVSPVGSGDGVFAAGGEPEGAARGRGAAEEARKLLRRLGLWDIFRARPAPGFGFAAALLLAAALGVTTAAVWGSNRSLRGELARLSQRLTDAEGEVARNRVMLAQTREVNELLTAPESRVERLAGTKVAPRAAARIAYDSETHNAVIVATGLPPAPAGKAYQLWFISGGKPVPGGVFKINSDGRAQLNDTAPAGIGEISAFAVTLEDEGGVPAPKGEMYLLSSAS